VRAFFSLLKLYLTSTYDFGTFFSWFRQGPKGLAKGLGAIILFLYVIAAFGFFLFISSYQTYVSLKPFNMEAVVIQNGIVSATVITWVFGFITCLATYSMTGAESFLLSLPLKPRALFGAKFALVYVSEAAMAFLMVAVSTGVYAFFERPGPLFYAYALFIAILTPLLPMAAFYFILVPLMKTVRFLRRRDVVTILGGVLGVGLAMGWQLTYQRMMMRMGDAEWVLKNLADPGSAMARLAGAFPPARWAAQALNGYSTAGGAGAFFLYAGVQVTALALALLVLAGPYARSLTSFNETYITKLKDSGGFIGASFKGRSQFAACLKREILIMLREPAYLLNGPFVIILMPIIFSVMYLSLREELLKDMPFLTESASLNARSIAAMGFAAFLGSMTSITATSISREGKQFWFVKSLPLKPLPYLGAKLAHGLAYCVFSAVAAPILISLIAPLGAVKCVLAGFAGFGISAFLNVAGLFMDTLNPRLEWPNAMVSIKQNPSAVVAALGGMAFVGGICALGGFLSERSFFLPLVGAAGTVLAAIAFRLYYPWARKRLEALE
jgi:ABC-2 type transport system permease protein